MIRKHFDLKITTENGEVHRISGHTEPEVLYALWILGHTEESNLKPQEEDFVKEGDASAAIRASAREFVEQSRRFARWLEAVRTPRTEAEREASRPPTYKEAA